MRYILSEQQNERIMKLIKSVGDTYTDEYVVKTDVEVDSANDDSGGTYYILYPIFYLDLEQNYDRNIMNYVRRFSKHDLANFVQSVVGFPIHSHSIRIKMI
jgi:hypothetical protein